MTEMSTPDWEYWRACATVTIWEGVALSLNRDPSSVRRDHGWRTYPDPKMLMLVEVPFPFEEETNEFRKRLSIVERGLRSATRTIAIVQRNGRYFDWVAESSSLREFFGALGVATPPQWAGVCPSDARAAKSADRSPGWFDAAEEFWMEIRKAHPKWSDMRVAEAVADRLIKAGIAGRSGKYPKSETIARHIRRRKKA